MVEGGKGLKWGATAVVAHGGGSGVVVAITVMVMLVGCC